MAAGVFLVSKKRKMEKIIVHIPLWNPGNYFFSGMKILIREFWPVAGLIKSLYHFLVFPLPRCLFRYNSP
jgi:hypothetical protein